MYGKGHSKLWNMNSMHPQRTPVARLRRIELRSKQHLQKQHFNVYIEVTIAANYAEVVTLSPIMYAKTQDK
jgi:hypothetical protein